MCSLIDHHCHLDFPELQNNLDDIISNAKENKIDYFLSSGTRLSNFENLLNLAKNHGQIFCSVGVHPHYADEEKVSVDELCQLSKNEKVIGIGECGLDYFYDSSERASQRELFRKHICAARQTNLPLIVHTRDADKETIEILQDEYKNGSFQGVIHCYSTGRELAAAALEMGLYISVSGIITFPRSHDLRHAIMDLVPLDRLLVETDAPYLAPVPYRGKTNEPAYVLKTAEKLADMYNVSLQEIAQKTTQNFKNLYKKSGL
jgi:TatD DNase family protein